MIHNCNAGNIKKLANNYKIYCCGIILYILKNCLINAPEKDTPTSINTNDHFKSD